MTALSGELVNRRAGLQIGIRGSGSNQLRVVNPDDQLDDRLRVSFTVTKTVKPDPNTARIVVSNLSPDNRSALENAEGLYVQLSAGYVDGVFEIFAGDLRRAITTLENKTTYQTIIESGDGEKRYQKARINKSFAPGTTTRAAVTALVAALDVGEGNLADVADALSLGGTGTSYGSGVTLSGQASAELTELVRSVGYEWLIRDGNILFLKRGQPHLTLARKLTPNTGLVGSPTVDNDGVLNAQCLMIAGVDVGNAVVVESKNIQGTYRVEKATFSGDTRGQDWYVSFQGKRV